MQPELRDFLAKLVASRKVDNLERNVAIVWWHNRNGGCVTPAEINADSIAARFPAQKIDRIRTGLIRDSKKRATRIGRAFCIRPEAQLDLDEAYSSFAVGDMASSADRASSDYHELTNARFASNPIPADSQSPLDLFYCYSHKDEALRDELQAHLSILKRLGIIREWHDRRITGGREWENSINVNIEKASVILLLVSSDFLASDYCYDIEMKRAMERHHRGEARVIPVILRPVDWKGAAFGKLQALPRDAKPVTTWENRDAAFHDVATGIRKAIGELQAASVAV